MLTHFQKNSAIELFGVNSKDIVSTLTPTMIINIMTELGAETHEQTQEYLIFPTICHNPYGETASMKLYYYLNSRLFHCYTGCSETMNIFKVIQKIKETNSEPISYRQALSFIINFYEDGEFTPINHVYVPLIAKYQKQLPLNQLEVYDSTVLSCFTPHYTPEWLQEGITHEIHNYFNIGYSIPHNAISIPHFNISGGLVGIRGRRLDYENNSRTAKYAPLTIEGKLYSHPLSLNLYGLYENREGIASSRRVIIFESEKSVMKHRTMYGENSCAVACCGSTINIVQIRLIMRFFHVNEVVIAFDKEYESYPSVKGNLYFEKLYRICSKYTHYANMSFLFDKNNLLEEKDAPIDKGQNIFEQLFNSRISVI